MIKLYTSRHKYCLIFAFAKRITPVSFATCIDLSARSNCVSREEFSCMSIMKIFTKIFVHNHCTWIRTYAYDDFGLWHHLDYSVDQDHIFFSINRCSLVGIVSMLQDERSGFRIPVGARSFSSLLNVSTGSGPHWASYLIATGGGSLPVGTAAGAWI